MDYLESIISRMDDDTRRRLEDGEYIKLLYKTFPSEKNALNKMHLNYAFSAIERGRDCVSIISAYKDLPFCRVLDLGCGDGGLAVAFSLAGAQVTAIEISERLIERAMALARDFEVDINFMLETQYGDSLPAALFDVVISNDVIEHVDSFERLAKSHARLLKSEGVLFINPPNRYSLRNLVRDPHFHMPGVSIMNRKMMELYLLRIRKVNKRITLNRLLGFGEVKRIYKRAGIDLYCFSDERIKQRLINRDFSSTFLKGASRLLPLGLAVPLIRHIIVDQWIFIGRHFQ